MSDIKKTYKASYILKNGEYVRDDEKELISQSPNLDGHITVDIDEVDYVMKINMWLLQKYGKELREEYGLTDNTEPGHFQKVKSVLDKIYEEQQKETPKPYFCYGLGL